MASDAVVRAGAVSGGLLAVAVAAVSGVVQEFVGFVVVSYFSGGAVWDTSGLPRTEKDLGLLKS